LTDVGGCSEGSDLQAVKTAYKKLALLHHPDRNGDEEAFKRISNAFKTLSKHFEAPAPVGRHAHYHEFDIFELFNMFHFGMFPRYSFATTSSYSFRRLIPT
jgi:curved DNA-binding protein CbpA